MDYRASPSIQKSAQAIKAGEVVAYPTEAVWGLGADPFNRGAVEKILRLKGRSVNKGLILVAACIEQFEAILYDLPGCQKELLLSSWPGPTNWLVAHQNRVPRWVSGHYDTVALRVSAHPAVKALCMAYGSAIISTSANPQGLMPARYSYRARQYFGRSVEYCAGRVDLSAQPCQIRDLNSGQVVRA